MVPRLNKFRIFLFMWVVFLIISIGILKVSPNKPAYKKFTPTPDLTIHDTPNNIFNVTRTDTGGLILPPTIKRFSNVCIEKRRQAGTRSLKTMITVYGSSDVHLRKNITVITPQKAFNYTWKLSLVPGSIPDGHHVINATAFFSVLTYPANIYHFLNDTYFPIFSMMHIFGILGDNTTKYLLYAPSDQSGKAEKYRNFEWFLQFLKIDSSHNYFDKFPSGTCFTDAIFGQTNIYKVKYKQTPIHILRENTPYQHCPQKLAVIIDRQRRRILNIGEVKEAISGFGYEARTVVMEKLTVEEQFMLMKCCSLFIGVKGAGLQWGQFMAEGSAVIEISWPSLSWMPFFKYFNVYGLHHYDLNISSSDVIVNWDDYEQRFTGGKKLSTLEKRKIKMDFQEKFPLEKRLIETDMNLYKWADVYVDIVHLQNTIKQVMSDTGIKKKS